MKFATNYSFEDFIIDSYQDYFDDKFALIISKEREQFLKDYPFEKLDELSLYDYCRNKTQNEKKPSFIRYIEFLTNNLQSSKTGSIEHRIFYEKNNQFFIYDKYKGIFKGETVEKSFEVFKKSMINFIKNFDPYTYKKNDFLPANLNAIKSKLIYLYRFETDIFGFSSQSRCVAFAESIGLNVSSDDDTISVLIKIKDFIKNNNKLNKLDYVTVVRLCWQYYIKYVDLSNSNEMDFFYENSVGENCFTQNGAKITKLDIERAARNATNSKRALKNSNYMCEYDPTHNSFTKRDGKTKYLECHHLIPYNIKTIHIFEGKNLDDPRNIVALCSECHNIIHYGEKKSAVKILFELYNKRKTLLAKIGIDIRFSELKKFYNL